jgi:aspartate-semialdehyde dehydrogenase
VPRAARGAPGLTVVDDPANGLYPTALDAAGRDDVLVGPDPPRPSHERCLNLWIVGEQPPQGRRHERRAGGRAPERARRCCRAAR